MYRRTKLEIGAVLSHGLNHCSFVSTETRLLNFLQQSPAFKTSKMLKVWVTGTRQKLVEL